MLTEFHSEYCKTIITWPIPNGYEPFGKIWQECPEREPGLLFTYISKNRPLTFLIPQDLSVNKIQIGVVNNGRQSIIYTDIPISLEEIANKELYPCDMGQFIVDFCNEINEDIVLVSYRDQDNKCSVVGIRVATITKCCKNKNYKWQITYWDHKGPVSDSMGNDKSELAKEAWRSGYRELNKELFDMMALDFDESLLVLMQNLNK